MITRRLFIAGTAATAFTAPALLRAQSVFRDYPFSLGVASGDPSPDGFVIWTRLAPRPLDEHGGMAMAVMNVRWEVAADPSFKTIVAKGEEPAHPELAHSVHVELSGLLPDRFYWYRFFAGGEASIKGRARTLPALGSTPQSLGFAMAGCQHYESGYYTAYAAMAQEELAFVYHYGDYIYEDRGSPLHRSRGDVLSVAVRQQAGQLCYDLADYRRRYAQYKSDPDLQRAHAAHAFFHTFDDHEVSDNWAGDHDDLGNSPELVQLRRAGAFQAWYEHMPVRRAQMPQGPSVNMYRAMRYGDLAAFDFLDTRQYRSGHPCGSDFAPACPRLMDPTAQMISGEEEAWLARNLVRRDARWNCIAQQVMMMSIDRRVDDSPQPILNLDSWAGYEVPRRRILGRMKGLDNVVVLTGDEHQNFAGLLRDGDSDVAVEFVGTSISSDGDGADLRAGSDRILAENPQIRFINYQRGYLAFDVTPDAWSTRYMVVDKVSVPGGKVSKRATATVERGRPDLHIA